MNSDNGLKEQNVFKESGEKKNPQSELSGNKTSSGLEQNIAGLLCYVFWFITGIFFLVIEKENRFVRFHAMQSIVFFGGIWVIGFVIDYVPYIGWMISSLVSLFGFIMWIVFMIKAYQKEYFKFPIVGQIADDFVNKK